MVLSSRRLGGLELRRRRGPGLLHCRRFRSGFEDLVDCILEAVDSVSREMLVGPTEVFGN